MHSCLSKAITIIAMVVLLASSALHPQSVHAASFTIDNNFINNAKQKVQVAEPGYIQGEDCTHWLSWFLETVYGMPTSFGSNWTDTLVHHLINDGDATVVTGDGQYDSGGFIPVSQVPSYLASLDSTLLENGGSREYIFAYKWTASYATSALADHLAAYVGGKQVVSHGINDGSGIYTWSHEYNLVPRAWNGFSGMNQVAIIALINGATASPPTSNPIENIDSPPDQPDPGNTVAGKLTISGWAIDQASSSGTGVDRVDIYADSQAGPGHSAIASISNFSPRPDVANVYGSQFLNSGYSTTIDINGWANGTHTLYVYEHSTISGSWPYQTRSFTVDNAVGSLDQPSNQTVASNVPLLGWACDPAASSGTGIDMVDMYVDGLAGQGGTFVTRLTSFSDRSDVVTAGFGQHCLTSGFSTTLGVDGWGNGTHTLYMYAHSIQYGWSQHFNTQQFTVAHTPGCSSDRAGQFADAYNRVGGTAELGAPSQCAGWYDTNNPGTLMMVQRFDHTADFGPSLISHDQPDDTPRDSIPAFVTRSGVGGAYMNTFGGPGGSLGVPTSDEYNTGTGAAENFAHGALLWNNGNPMAQYWPTTFAGWKAEYWDRPNSSDGQNAFVGPPTYVDDEPAITYDWGTNGPANGHIGVWSAHFSARWTRTLTFAPRSYTFTMVVDDGGRLLIDGAPVIDQWHDANRATYTWTGDLSGSHSMEMDYYQNGDNAVAQLAWAQNIPPTNTPTDTQAPTNVPVSTPVPSATQGDVSIPTNTPLPATAVPPAPTNTTAPVSTATPTPTNTATSTATALPVPSATGTPTPTDTPMSPSPTMTPPPAPTMPAPPPAVPTNTTAPTSAASIPTAPPSSTPGSNPVTAPIPAVAPPSPIRPTSTPARPTALPPMPSPTTYAPEPQTPTPNPTPPLTVRMAGQSVTSGNTLTITIHTSPRAKIALALYVTTTRTTFTGTGKHRRRVSRTIWLYHLTGGGTVDKRGGYIGKLHVSYAPAKPTRASLTVTARTARGVVTRTTWVAIQPRRRYGRR